MALSVRLKRRNLTCDVTRSPCESLCTLALGAMMKRPKNLLLALGLLAASACSAPQPASPPPPIVAVGLPLQRSITDWDDYVGRFEAVEDVEILARVSGHITRIAFKEGLVVPKGALLYEIDPRPYRAALAQAEAEVSRSAHRAVTESERARAETLLPHKAVSQELYEQRLPLSGPLTLY